MAQSRIKAEGVGGLKMELKGLAPAEPLWGYQKPSLPVIDSSLYDSVNLSSRGDSFLSSMNELRVFARGKTKELSTVSQASFKSGFVNDYMDARQIDNRVMDLAVRYPDLVKVTTRDFKTEGYDGKEESLRVPSPLRYVTLSTGKKSDREKPGVLLMASPHAREKVNPLVMVELLEELCANYNPGSSDPKIREITTLVDSLNIYIVPVSNPDGLSYAVHDDARWRKTRSSIPGSQEKGVDINRNFDYMWEPSEPSAQTYSGTAPFSEPETRHIARIAEEHPDIRFACDFHSMGEEVRIPVGIEDSGDMEIYRTVQQRMISAIGESRGKHYEPVFSDVVNGASDDYLYHKKGIYALVVEDGSAFSPPRDEALNVVKDITAGAIELLKVACEMGEKERTLPAAA